MTSIVIVASDYLSRCNFLSLLSSIDYLVEENQKNKPCKTNIRARQTNKICKHTIVAFMSGMQHFFHVIHSVHGTTKNVEHHTISVWYIEHCTCSPNVLNADFNLHWTPSEIGFCSHAFWHLKWNPTKMLRSITVFFVLFSFVLFCLNRALYARMYSIPVLGSVFLLVGKIDAL